MSSQTPNKQPAGQPATKPLGSTQSVKPNGATPTPAASPAAKRPDAPAADIAKDDVVKAVDKLETRMKAINANNIARVANSHLNGPEEKLYPLLSLKTGKTVEKFPATPSALSKLGYAQVDTILNTLEADRSGSEEAKRERLRLQIGLKPRPV